MDVKFFALPGEFRVWLKSHHAKSAELLVGFYTKGSGKVGMTYAEALDEALCFGWIDGVRKNINEVSYSIRFTPRKSGSIWSLINVKHVERLLAAKRMMARGIKAFEARKPDKTGIYSFEQKTHALFPAQEKAFRANRKAWTYWEAQPPGYRRVSMHWVTSAKQEATRERRLAQLIVDSAAGRRVGVVIGKNANTRR